MRSIEESKAYRLLMFNAIKNHLPLNVLVELTYHCNLDCLCCYNVNQPGKLLQLDEYDRLFKELRDAGTFLVTLTGGEPLMRKDFFDILALVREHGFAVRIFTNGTLLDEKRVIRLKQYDISGVELSIWGSTPEINDRLMGKPGAYEKILNAARLLVKHDIITTVKTTICAENYIDFKNIKDLVRGTGAQFRYSMLLSLKSDGDPGNYLHRLNAEQFKEFYRIHDQDAEPEELEKDLIDDEVLRQSRELPDYMCLAGISSCKIDPFGHVNPCVDIPVVAGNIREQDFRTIWKEAPVLTELRGLRKSDATDCLQCDLKDHCHRCPGMALLESGSLTAKYDYGCLMAATDKLFRNKINFPR